jgi:hypothetical protein
MIATPPKYPVLMDLVGENRPYSSGDSNGG